MEEYLRRAIFETSRVDFYNMWAFSNTKDSHFLNTTVLDKVFFLIKNLFIINNV